MLGSFDENDALPELDLAMRNLPATASLPSFTVKTPKEKLTTVLKESERLLRSARPDLPKTSSTRRLDNFIISLKEDCKQKAVLQKLQPTEPKGWVSRLPDTVLTRKPRLSTDNCPDDDLEIVAGNVEKINFHPKSTRISRQSVAPKVKKASITKLNEELNTKIQKQHRVTLEERNTEKELLRRKALEILEKEEKQPDEFGISEDDDNGDYGRGDYGHGDEELSEQIYEEMINYSTMVINSEDEATQPDFNSLPKITRPKLAFSDDEDLIEQLIPDENSDDEEKNPQGLTLMLSGQFAAESDNNLGGANMESDLGDASGDDLGNADEDDLDDVDVNLGCSDENTRLGDKTAHNAGFFEFEAEDEDSQVSADEIDEEAIARELEESAFFDDAVVKATNGSDQLAFHRQMRAEREDEEMEMFINRFVPENVLRETGAYAEMRRKYADDSDEEATKLANTKSMYGKVRVHKPMESKSHPDFLKLLDQDRLSASNSESDSAFDSPLEEEEEEEELLDEKFLDSNRMDSLLTTSITINPQTPTSGIKRLHISVNDGELFARLSTKDKDEIPDNKKNRTTFETVSSRPVIEKEKVRKRK